MQIVEQATPSPQRSSPRPVRNAIIAGFLGLTLGLFVVALLVRFDEHIRDEDELVALIAAPVLARIPKAARTRRTSADRTASQSPAFLESFQFLRLNVQIMAPQGGSLVVAMTSPAADDGKTTVVGWLARALAVGGAGVVAVDLDLRNPTLHSYFDVGREPGRGVVDALLESHGENDLTQPTQLSNLRVLSAGDDPVLPGRLRSQERLHDLLGRLRAHADYVLVDTPPLSTSADASEVAAAADGVILVIDLKRIRRTELLAATQQLVIARANIIGIVLNRAPSRSPAYYDARPRARVAPDGPGSTAPHAFSA